MSVIPAISATLTGLKTASDLTTRLREALGSGEVKLDEVLARIIELQGFISDGRTALIDVQEEIHAKNEEIRRLNEQLRALHDIRDNYELRQGVYVRKGTQDAYCPLCLGANNKAVPLMKDGDGWTCGIHNVHFPGDDEAGSWP